jgi:threonine dehydrogenase-like Zn-dependent dehydrogenase
MKQQVLVFRDSHDAILEERDMPELRPDEFRIATTHSLVSPGTELALYRKTHIGFDDPEITWCAYPLEIGYASTGIVSESRSSHVAVGDRIVHYGPHATVVTIGPSGPIWAPVPENISSTAACFGRFAQIAYSSVTAAPRPVGHVLVYGAGIVGNLAAQWFRDSGADTAIVDMSARRLEIARRCGIFQTERVGAPRLDDVDTTSGVDGGRNDRPNTIIEATGVATVVGQALDRVAIGGQVVLLGSIRHEVTINAYKQIHRKAVILSGAHETILGGDRVAVLANSLDALASERLQVDPIVTKTISPTELPGVYEQIIREPDEFFGVVVVWDDK